jgi:hypothetical protein
MKRRTKLFQEGEYAVAVEVELIESVSETSGWAPYLSLDDARRLDAARAALRQGDLGKAGQLGKVYRLTPVTA